MESESFEVIAEVGSRVTIAVGFSETLVPIHQNVRHRILRNSDLDRLSNLENEVLRKMFGPKTGDGTRVS
jgi:hypothetical protein